MIRNDASGTAELDVDPSSMMKARKEAFVTGHGGSTPGEVLWVCSSVLWGCWLFAEVVLAKRKRKPSKQRSLLELVLVGLPTVLAQTKYLYPYGSLLMGLQIATAAAFSYKRIKTTKPTVENSPTKEPTPIAYLTLYRFAIYLLTFVAILAVDFPLFPRRFCKTEVAGYGLMDIGAASFVVSSGIASGKAYAVRKSTDSKSKAESLFRPLIKAAPLILIGIIRCATNKELDYQEHVSEYGVHWNFFFTLGVLAVVPTIRRKLLLSRDLPEMLERWVFWGPVLAMVLYQYELFVTRHDPNGLLSFILTAPRTPDLSDGGDTLPENLARLWMGFFFANREGILGCLGYCFVHAVGESIGQHYVFGYNNNSTSEQASPNEDKDATTPKKDAAKDDADDTDTKTGEATDPSATTTTATQGPTVTLIKPTIYAWFSLWCINTVFNLTASRRETNLPFCLWAIAHNLTILLGFQVLEWWIGGDDASSQMVGPAAVAVNKHGMVSFLVANLLTGATNLGVATIDTADGPALVILLAYLVAIGGAALLLESRRSGSGNEAKEKLE